MALIDIDGALIQGYLDMNLGLSTAYEGAHFTPPGNADWSSVSIVPASSDPVTLGKGGSDEHTGFMQIDFSTKPGNGRAGLLAYAQVVRDEFVAGSWYTKNSQGVLIDSVYRSAIRHVDGWLRVSVTVNWIARTIRPEI